MRSRALIVVSALSAAILIGCGGGGGGGGSKGTVNPPPPVPGATQPGDSIAMVNLPSPTLPTGRVNVAYLPLQGRALEDFTVLIRNIELGLGANTFVEPLASPISFVLNGNQVQQRSASISLDSSNSEFFDTFYLNIDTLIDDPSPGVPPDDATSYGTPTQPFVQEQGFPARVRVFPSRETTIPIFLNDAMISIVTNPDGTTTASFLPDVFTSQNTLPIQGFISDFLAIDTSAMGVKRPTMSTGAAADRMYFSGDRFALGAAGPSGYFEMLTNDLSNPRSGEFQDPELVGNTLTPGVWRTKVFDPTDPTHTTQITELYGIFRFLVDPKVNTRSMVVNTGGFEVILMPKTSDDDTLQILLIALNGSKATNLYWGDAHLASGSFVAYPAANLPTGSAVGAIQGTLSGFLNVSGSPLTVSQPSDAANVRYGRYSISGILPSGFSKTGRFIVFRR